MLCVQFTRLVTGLNWSSFIGSFQQVNSVKCSATFYILLWKQRETSLKIHKLLNMAKADSDPIEIQTWPQQSVRSWFRLVKALDSVDETPTTYKAELDFYLYCIV